MLCCESMRDSVAALSHSSIARFGLLFLWMLWSASATLADCTDFAGNQILNCSFEDGDPPVDWTAIYGQDFQRQTPGLEGLSAASLAPESMPPFGFWGVLLRSDCFPVSEDTIYRFGGHFRRSESVGTCSVEIDGFEDANCEGTYSSVGAFGVELMADEWVHLESEDVPGGQSGRLTLSCITSDVGGPGGPEVLVDGVYAIPLADLTEVSDLDALGRLVFALLLGALGVVVLLRR